MAPLGDLLRQSGEAIALLSLVFSLLAFALGIYQLHRKGEHPFAGKVFIVLGILSFGFAWQVYAKAPKSISPPSTRVDPMHEVVSTPTPALTNGPVVPPRTTLATDRLHSAEETPRQRHTSGRSDDDSATPPTGPITSSAPVEPSPPVPSKDIDEIEDDVVQIANRAGAIDDSLNRLRREQEKSGFGLRIDMAEHQHGMHNNLTAAKEALANRDVERARRLLDRSLRDVEALEHFLGR